MADSKNMRSGVLGAIYDYKNRKIVGTELTIIAVASGIYFASWCVWRCADRAYPDVLHQNFKFLTTYDINISVGTFRFYDWFQYRWYC